MVHREWSIGGSVEQSGWRWLPHAGLAEIVSRLQFDCSTYGARKLSGVITAVRSLGEDGLGGQRFLVPQHEAPAQSILPQRAQQKPKKKAANPKINGFLNLAGGIGEIRTLDKALHPILP